MKVAELAALAPQGQRSEIARRADPENPDRVRRNIQRALAKGTIEQAIAEEIAAAIGVEAERFLYPYERPDPRVTELRMHLRKVRTLREELGWAPRHSEIEQLSQDG